jgi:predicted outer membrane repeat protein
MYIYGSSLTVENCTFTINVAYESGAGIGCFSGSDLILTYCTLNSNIAIQSGAGIFLENSQATINKCTICENQVFTGGAGIYCASNSIIKVIESTITDNCGGNQGGGFSGIGDATFQNCYIYGNTACSGGGFATEGILTIIGCAIYLNYAYNGSSDMFGGAVYAMENSNCTIVNCTFSWNIAIQYGGAIYSSNNSNVTIYNSILWDDDAQSGLEIYVSGGTVSVSYSDVKGGWPGIGNINQNPQLVNPINNLRLTSVSPCIDAGDNNLVP